MESNFEKLTEVGIEILKKACISFNFTLEVEQRAVRYIQAKSDRFDDVIDILLNQIQKVKTYQNSITITVDLLEFELNAYLPKNSTEVIVTKLLDNIEITLDNLYEERKNTKKTKFSKEEIGVKMIENEFIVTNAKSNFRRLFNTEIAKYDEKNYIYLLTNPDFSNKWKRTRKLSIFQQILAQQPK